LPPQVSLGTTHGVAVDAEGFIHVLHTNQPGAVCLDCVIVLAPDGSFVRSWGPQFVDSGHGLHITQEAGESFAYITDLKRGLYKTTLKGEVVWRMEKPEFFAARPHLRYEPTNIAITPQGDVFLADGYGSYLIFRIDQNGKVVDVFGGPGVGDHHLAHPHGILYTERSGRPSLLVAENIATRLNYLTLSGEHLGFIEVPTRRPRHFAEKADGTLAIPDFYSRLTLIDRDDKLINHICDGWNATMRAPFSELENRPPKENEFARPHDAAFDRLGNLYVVEYLPQGRIIRLGASGLVRERPGYEIARETCT